MRPPATTLRARDLPQTPPAVSRVNPTAEYEALVATIDSLSDAE